MFFTVLPGTELWKANFNSTHHLGTWKGLFDAKGHMHGRRNVLYFWTSCRIEERKKSTKANFNSSSGLSRPFTSDSLLCSSDHLSTSVHTPLEQAPTFPLSLEHTVITLNYLFSHGKVLILSFPFSLSSSVVFDFYTMSLSHLSYL